MIKHLQTAEELLQGYTVMKELRPHLTEESFLEMNETMRREGYEVHALFEGEDVVAVTGIITLTNFYDGRHIYVYDLVTKATSRSKGYGEKLLRYIEELGKERGCEKVTLSSGLVRVDAHRFYEEKMDYEKASYVFRKKL
ncbi:GNAT family N-acetyltransferase [Sutcliffiella horikoshii]|uniref:GNAT family N-acetyltransferase n=1 Tax=Sutcliffiella horikoshii TaxID=79883 RepID=UPI001F412A0B|nr:GNAT family N-acetyltransferase [Sutcliffiella horikoshii]MCG1022579.1 GNAT family N-acetyltransferase [Sutcliffiella horikoshii]